MSSSIRSPSILQWESIRFTSGLPRNPMTEAQARADALVSSFVDHATDGYSLAGMVGGGLVYRLGRVGTMAIGSRLVGATHASPLHALVRLGSIGVGFTGEVFAFEAGQRALRVEIGGADPSLLNWSGENGLGRGLVGAAITLGPLKGAGVFAQGQNPVIQHLFQDSAMVLAHNVSGAIGITNRPTESLPEQMVNAEATLWQMNAGMALVHGAFPGLRQVERSLDLGIRGKDLSPSLSFVRRGGDMIFPLLTKEGVRGRSDPLLATAGDRGDLVSNAFAMTGIARSGGSGRRSPLLERLDLAYRGGGGPGFYDLEILMESLLTRLEEGGRDSPTRSHTLTRLRDDLHRLQTSPLNPEIPEDRAILLRLERVLQMAGLRHRFGVNTFFERSVDALYTKFRPFITSPPQVDGEGEGATRAPMKEYWYPVYEGLAEVSEPFYPNKAREAWREFFKSLRGTFPNPKNRTELLKTQAPEDPVNFIWFYQLLDFLNHFEGRAELRVFGPERLAESFAPEDPALDPSPLRIATEQLAGLKDPA